MQLGATDLTDLDGYELGSFVSAPSDFGPGGPTYSDFGSGDAFHFLASIDRIVVSNGYVSGDPLSGSNTWIGHTFTSLGITPGSYLWVLDNGDTITLNTAAVVPVPAAVWLFGSGLGLLGWLRRRQHT